MPNGRNPSDEFWVPRCPKCGGTNLTLAPANQYTKHIVAQVEIYCSSCQFIAKLADSIKAVYVRI